MWIIRIILQGNVLNIAPNNYLSNTVIWEINIFINEGSNHFVVRGNILDVNISGRWSHLREMSQNCAIQMHVIIISRKKAYEW